MRYEIHAPAAVPSAIDHPVPLNRKLTGLHSRSGPFGEETNLLPLPESEQGSLRLPAYGLISIPTDICRLQVHLIYTIAGYANS